MAIIDMPRPGTITGICKSDLKLRMPRAKRRPNLSAGGPAPLRARTVFRLHTDQPFRLACNCIDHQLKQITCCGTDDCHLARNKSKDWTAGSLLARLSGGVIARRHLA
jgi:hypothetical protein